MKKNFILAPLVAYLLALLFISPAWAGGIAILDSLNQKGAQVTHLKDAQMNEVRAKGVAYTVTLQNSDWFWLFMDKNNQPIYYADANPSFWQASYQPTGQYVAGNAEYFYDGATNNLLFAVNYQLEQIYISPNTQRVFRLPDHPFWDQLKYFTMVEKNGRSFLYSENVMPGLPTRLNAYRIYTGL